MGAWNVDLNRKLSYGSIFVVIMLLLGGLAALSTTHRLAKTAAAVRHTDALLDSLDDALGLLVDVELGAHAYELTGRDEFLGPYRSARDRLPAALASLRPLAADDIAQGARIERLDRLVEERVATAAQHIELTHTGAVRTAAATAAAVSRSKAAVDQIRQLVEDLRQEERRLLVERTQADHAASLRTYRVLGAVFTVAIILVLSATMLIRRGILQRTQRLLQALERMAAGDLGVRVEPGVPDELGRLAAAFNETARQRRQVEEDLARANALLEGLFRASPLAIAALDLAGNVEVWNPAAERIFGWTAEELIGKPLPAIPDAEASSFASVRERVLVGREVVPSLEHRPRRRDGTLFDASSSAAPLLCNGELEGIMVIIEDITARKQAVESLRESEERFRLALDEAPIGMALVGLDGRFLRVNRSLCEIVGYSREELTGLTFQAITHPDDVNVDVALRQRLARGEIPRYQLDKRYLRKDGAVVDVMSNGSIVRANDGAPLYFIAQIEDITDRKQAEEALRRSEAQFRGLIERMPDGVLVDRDGRVAYANGALATLLGYDDAAALVGRPLAELLHPDDRPAVAERRRRLQGGFAEPPQELRLVRRDGSTCSAETTGIQLQFDEQPGIVVIVRDLTDRKRAESARQESLQRLRVVLDLAPVAIALSTDGRTWEGNRRAQRLFGRRIGPSLELSEYAGALLDAADKPLAFEDVPWTRALQGEQLEAVELRLRQPDGHIVPIQVNAAPIPGGETTPPGAVVSFEDISTLKDFDQLRVEWNSLVAHDLRQPLSSITLYAQLAADQTANHPALHKIMQRIREAARRLNRMIEDLLDYSRLETRQLTLSRHPVQLADLVREATDRMAPEAPNRPIELRVHGEPARIDIDADRIAQVMDNLLSNAIKYGEPATPIVVDVEGRADSIAVSVTNHGPGIAPDQLPYLFTRFQRAEETRHGGVKGIGLGLYISRGLVEAHGGHIVAESIPGRLTTFQFTLPLAARVGQRAEMDHHPS